MKQFFNPTSVAIIGASEQPGKIGNILLQNLITLKFKGKIYPVNPSHKNMLGKTCYTSVSDIPGTVDLAIIAIPAAFVPAVVKECATRKKPIRQLIVISAGFSESGAAGKQLEAEIKSLAKQYKLQILGPNCLGVINAHTRFNGSFSKNNFPTGKIGLIMQSGAFVTALFDLAAGEQIGFSLVATLGNKAVLDEVDVLKHLTRDPHTEIIAMYLEDIKRGPQFCQALRQASRKKPVLVLKAGNSQRAQAAILSHTGAMAGQAAVARQAIEENGGLYFDNLVDFVHTLKLLHNFRLPRTNQLAIVTNAGGPGVVTTDLVEQSRSLRLCSLSDNQKQMIHSLLPPAASAENPIDVLGDADAERYAVVFKHLDDIKGIGAVLAIVTPQAQTDIEAIANVIIQANQEHAIPIVPLVIGHEAALQAIQAFQSSSLPLSNFTYPLLAINALERALHIATRPKASPAQQRMRIDGQRKSTNDRIKDQAMKQGRSVFYYAEAAAIARRYGIRSSKSASVSTPQDAKQARCAFPVVLKIDSTTILHKNAKGGIRLDIGTPAALAQTIAQFRTAFPQERLLVQTQAPSGFEVIIGLKKDPTFGHVLMIGLGGIMTEIFDQKLLWILPVDKRAIRTRLERSIIAQVFAKQRLALDQLIQQAEQVVQMAVELPWIEQLDINPLIFYPGKQPLAVDIKVVMEK